MRRTRQRPAGLRAVALALAVVCTAVAAPPRSEASPVSETVRSPRAAVTLVAETASVRPEQPFRVGLEFVLAEGWHVYWRNPGDSGTAPELRWTLPRGWTAGEVAWPYPEAIAAGPFLNYGYDGRVLLPVILRPQAPGTQVSGGTIRVDLDARWLVCKEECIPEEGSFSLELPLADAPPAPGAAAQRFRATDDRVPRDVPGVRSTLSDAADGRLRVVVHHPAELPLAGGRLEFFTADPAAVEHAAAPQFEVEAGRVGILLEPSPYAAGRPDTLRGVLVAHPDGDDAGPAVAVAISAVRETSAAGTETAEASSTGLLAALLMAFGGGVLLNLMPCVFPVVSIKVLALVGHAGDPATGRRHGWLFSGGILVSFWILAGILLALRAAGQGVGWGFQLQSPTFLGLLALLFFGIGLNFLGAFEVGVSLGTRAATGARQGGSAGAFFQGMLATVIATPCTAPFMGAAIGFALLVEPWWALLVFTALGAGMASPYVVLTRFPAALERLPRPGPWMETLRQIMAFPIFATVVWLIWVVAGQRGPAGVLAVLIGILLLGLAGWIAGRYAAAGHRRRLAQGLVVALVLGAVWTVIPGGGSSGTAVASDVTGPEDGLEWIAWDPGVVERLRSEGRPVYVDFTARWCLTCQVNKKVVFSSDRVREAFADRGVALVRADWTSRDPRITKALAAFGRSGVPLNVYFPPGADAAPVTLPAVLSPGIVLDALN